MYDPSDPNQKNAFEDFKRVVLFFESDEERTLFEAMVSQIPERIMKQIDNSTEFEYIMTENNAKTELYKQRLRTGIILNKLLLDNRVAFSIALNIDTERLV